MTKTAKTIVEEVLSYATTKRLWTANYLPALPFTPQDFSIGAVLPATFYMFRWGHRRGRGNFISTFGRNESGKAVPPTIADVANGLLALDTDQFEGFDSERGKFMLGDLILAFCLENKKHALGHAEQVQRAFPTHYMASWIDLPAHIGHLRGIPEFIVALLAHQENGESVEASGKSRLFSVASGFDDNILLKLFGKHMAISGSFQSNLASDSFIEGAADHIGIDQLLTVRIAQA